MIVLSFALPEESRGIVRRLTDARRSGSAALPVISGRLAGREVVVVHTGMGMDSATERLGKFLDEHAASAPSALIASGFGGGLAEDLRVGDIVVAENFSDAALLGLIASIPARIGSLITTRRLIDSAEEKKSLARHTGAIVVDMETAAIQRVCGARGIPMLAVRAISDTAGQDMPVPAEVWFDVKRQCPRPLPLVLHLAMHPGRVGPFVEFVLGIRRARARLTDFLLAAVGKLNDE